MTLEWRLRRATAADAEACALLAGASFLEAFAGVLDGADIVRHVAAKSSARAFDEWIADPACVVCLAEAATGAAPLGYTVLADADLPVSPRDGDIELRRIYALTRMHGTGLGAALMRRALDDARASGRRRVLLGVYGGNLRARRFYERQGFTAIGTRRFLVGTTWHDDLVFARDL